MLSWFKDLVAPIRKHDARFGGMRYLRDARFWEARTSFRPTGREIEVLILGEATGPREEQRTFFDQLEERYDSLWPTIKDKLDTEARRVGALSNKVELVSVGIPERFWQDAGWEMSYETRSPSWHFTVRLRGWVPTEIIAEC